MAIDVADTRDFAERAGFDLPLEEHMDGLAAHEVTSLEDKSFLFNGMSHLPGICGGKAKRFFYIEMFLGGDRLGDEFFMSDGF